MHVTHQSQKSLLPYYCTGTTGTVPTGKNLSSTPLLILLLLLLLNLLLIEGEALSFGLKISLVFSGDLLEDWSITFLPLASG
jgi:hypothetical protein